MSPMVAAKGSPGPICSQVRISGLAEPQPLFPMDMQHVPHHCDPPIPARIQGLKVVAGPRSRKIPATKEHPKLHMRKTKACSLSSVPQLVNGEKGDSNHERSTTPKGLILGQLRAASAPSSSRDFQWRKASWPRLCVTFLEDLQTPYTVNGLQRNIRATPGLQKLSGDVLANSSALAASGVNVRGDKTSRFIKTNKLKVSGKSRTCLQRDAGLWTSSLAQDSAAMCLASYFPALGPDFLF